eukprot:SAG31_NODE_994_length_10499_cov_6.293452_5_plen_154_part_00
MFLEKSSRFPFLCAPERCELICADSTSNEQGATPRQASGCLADCPPSILHPVPPTSLLSTSASVQSRPPSARHTSTASKKVVPYKQGFGEAPQTSTDPSLSSHVVAPPRTFRSAQDTRDVAGRPHDSSLYQCVNVLTEPQVEYESAMSSARHR